MMIKLFMKFKLSVIIKLDLKAPIKLHPYYNALPIYIKIKELLAHLLQILILLNMLPYTQHGFYEEYFTGLNYLNFEVSI